MRVRFFVFVMGFCCEGGRIVLGCWFGWERCYSILEASYDDGDFPVPFSPSYIPYLLNLVHFDTHPIANQPKNPPTKAPIRTNSTFRAKKDTSTKHINPTTYPPIHPPTPYLPLLFLKTPPPSPL